MQKLIRNLKWVGTDHKSLRKQSWWNNHESLKKTETEGINDPKINIKKRENT